MSSSLAADMQNIQKTYRDGTVALRGVDFNVREGEIHALIGENGAGKTTLMKILYGLLKPTAGKILIRGREVNFRHPRDAIKNGVGMVQQHFALVPDFTVVENIVLGSEPCRQGVVVDYKSAAEAIKKLSEETGLHVDPESRVEGLPVGVQQRVEILKMLYRGAMTLILDEPTSVLSPIEVEDFFKILKGLRDKGRTIIFVTHKLKEALAISDRITVMRAGRVTGVVNSEGSTPQILANMMVGREVEFKLVKKPVTVGEPLLEVEDLWVRSDKGLFAVKGLNFTVRRGEIFGVAGVEGNGQSELVESLTGLRKVEKGRVKVNGKDVTNAPPNELTKVGVGHIPEDRHKRGLILDFDLAENLVLGSQSNAPFGTRFTMSLGTIYDYAQEAIGKFSILAPSEKVRVKYLSGGNQQRIVVARELGRNPDFIVAAQPTRGLDVAATEYVRTILLKMREGGKAVLLISSDLDEILQLSDRVAVIYEGAFVDVRKPEELTEEKIGLMMGGVKPES